MPDLGYKCKCGRFNKATGWAAAHWGGELNHECECGRKNVVKLGKVLRTTKIPRKWVITEKGKVELKKLKRKTRE